MIRLCPECTEEAEIAYGMCTNCGEEYRQAKKTKDDQFDIFDEEEEWSDEDWGEDIEKVDN